MNQVVLMGRLGKEVELKYVKDNTAVANFSMATSDYNGKEKVDNWHNVVAWGKLAENLQRLTKKGSRILVVGSTSTDSWEDGDGNKKYKTKVTANYIEVIDFKETKSDSGGDFED